MTETNPRDYKTTGEAVRELQRHGISLTGDRIAQLCRDGKVKYTRLGGGIYRVYMPSLLAMVKSRESESCAS